MGKPAKKIAELTQRVLPLHTRTMTLYEDRIELAVRSPFERYRFPFYVQVLKEEPDEVVWVPWKAILLGAAVGIAGAVLALAGGRPADPVAGTILAGLGAVLLAGSLLCIRRLHVYFYKAVPGRDPTQPRLVPQLYVLPDRPSREEVRRFEETLSLEREKQMDKARIEGEEGVPYARELERFANLRRDNLVTEEEYAMVKAKLLAIKPRKIGF